MFCCCQSDFGFGALQKDTSKYCFSLILLQTVRLCLKMPQLNVLQLPRPRWKALKDASKHHVSIACQTFIQKKCVCLCACTCVCVFRESQVLTHQLCKEMRVKTQAFMCDTLKIFPRGITFRHQHTYRQISLKAYINCFTVMLTPDPKINGDQNDDEGWKRVKAAYSNCFSQSEQTEA